MVRNRSLFEKPRTVGGEVTLGEEDSPGGEELGDEGEPGALVFGDVAVSEAGAVNTHYKIEEVAAPDGGVAGNVETVERVDNLMAEGIGDYRVDFGGVQDARTLYRAGREIREKGDGMGERQLSSSSGYGSGMPKRPEGWARASWRRFLRHLSAATEVSLCVGET